MPVSVPLGIELSGHNLELFAGGGLHWPEHQALMVSDLHLGKDATFRRHGIGVPTGASRATLRAVSEMLDASGATELFIIGDLFHARSSLSLDATAVFEAFLRSHSNVAVTLIEGNHDRAVGQLPKNWPIDTVEGTFHLDSIAMTHEPSNLPCDADLLVSGHLHPAHVLNTGGETTGKLPCFWWSNGCLVLPACGRFTGTMKISPKNTDRIWVIADGQVLAV
ncbi:ligase-associated DNA damage response endonuclease PdeM [Rhodopirellula sp. JC740]|uniref:Ligase-associated DNA damage response endonuclease PdeM n=1 Tax=Rhodopirellula halodulae TaxID=2894198 RepID=A0ABS8NJ74_9BACT|nr:ligase-associated DNA damage response endonuclease PdeM [Rhodopirellula sp. JC740]MCC9643581.1 ligase-associated DNA damage response endonuclease PdeM [Rhodopirellula sp. JC740]